MVPGHLLLLLAVPHPPGRVILDGGPRSRQKQQGLQNSYNIPSVSFHQSVQVPGQPRDEEAKEPTAALVRRIGQVEQSRGMHRGCRERTLGP